MTIEEAIKHCEEVADSKCDKRGAELKQLSKWLIELREHREREDKEDKERALAVERDDWERATDTNVGGKEG